MSENKDVHFKYKFPSDYNPDYVNGAYGGVSPNGEIVVNFYFERIPIPYEETVDLDTEAIKRTLPENHSENVIRYVPSGVVMNIDTAKSFHQWLGEHIKSLEKRRDDSASAEEGEDS